MSSVSLIFLFETFLFAACLSFLSVISIFSVFSVFPFPILDRGFQGQSPTADWFAIFQVISFAFPSQSLLWFCFSPWMCSSTSSEKSESSFFSSSSEAEIEISKSESESENSQDSSSELDSLLWSDSGFSISVSILSTVDVTSSNEILVSASVDECVNGAVEISFPLPSIGVAVVAVTKNLSNVLNSAFNLNSVLAIFSKYCWYSIINAPSIRMLP